MYLSNVTYVLYLNTPLAFFRAGQVHHLSSQVTIEILIISTGLNLVQLSVLFEVGAPSPFLESRFRATNDYLIRLTGHMLVTMD